MLKNQQIQTTWRLSTSRRTLVVVQVHRAALITLLISLRITIVDTTEWSIFRLGTSTSQLLLLSSWSSPKMDWLMVLPAGDETHCRMIWHLPCDGHAEY